MSIQYIPGWWDSIAENATGLAQQLPGIFQPDRVAKKKFERMIQQDPSLILKLSDLDETQRATFYAGLGGRDMTRNPVAGLPEGEGLQTRRRIAKTRSEMTPEQFEIFGSE